MPEKKFNNETVFVWKFVTKFKFHIISKYVIYIKSYNM